MKIGSLVNTIEVPVIPNLDAVSNLSEESSKIDPGDEGSPRKMPSRPQSSRKVTYQSDGAKSLPRGLKEVVSDDFIPRPEKLNLPPAQSCLLRNKTLDIMVIKKSPSRRQVEVIHHSPIQVAMPKIEQPRMHLKRRVGGNTV